MSQASPTMQHNAAAQQATEANCMNVNCSGRPAGRVAQFVLQLSFAIVRRGFRPQRHEAYMGVYVCAECATPQSSETFRNDNTRTLGNSIAAAFGGSLSWEHTRVFWAPRHNADTFFSRVQKHEQQLKEQRAAQLTASPLLANDNE